MAVLLKPLRRIDRKKLGMYQMLAERFPYAIYYEIVEDIAYVAAILPIRRNPEWIIRKLDERRE